MTIYQTSHVLDHLVAAKDQAVRDTHNDASLPAYLRALWHNAIDNAWDHLLQSETICFEIDRAIYVYKKVDGSEYRANGDCQCPAFLSGKPCLHRAAAWIVEEAVRTYEEEQILSTLELKMDYLSYYAAA